jgi:hypothetical protein
MKAVEVFTPGKEPGITYIDDHLKERAGRLADALSSGATVISLSGPSNPDGHPNCPTCGHSNCSTWPG